MHKDLGSTLRRDFSRIKINPKHLSHNLTHRRVLLLGNSDFLVWKKLYDTVPASWGEGGVSPKHKQKVSLDLEEAPNLRTTSQNFHWSLAVRIRLAEATGWNSPALPLVTPECPLKRHLYFKVKHFTISGV